MPQNTVIGGVSPVVSILLRTAPTIEPFAERDVGHDLHGAGLRRLGHSLLLRRRARQGRTRRAISRSVVARPAGTRLSQVVARFGVVRGSRISSCAQLVPKAFQPPSDGGPFLVVEPAHHALPIHRLDLDLEACLLELGLATGASCLMTPRSVGCGITTSAPSSLGLGSSSLGLGVVALEQPLCRP